MGEGRAAVGWRPVIERPISLFDGSEEVAGDFHILWREGGGNGIGAELGGAWGGGIGNTGNARRASWASAWEEARI